MELLPHPSNAPAAPRIEASVERAGESLIFTFVLIGDTAAVRLPSSAPSNRADNLWQTTCFEVFVAQGRESYIELNFSPSGQWAAYQFDGYRAGMRPLDMTGPRITFDGDKLIAEVSLTRESGAPIGLCAIIETTYGTKCYWALAHASGPPDFHNSDCFIAKLP